MVHWARVQLRSNWIDLLAIPILASIMEAQPTFVILVFISPAFRGNVTDTSFLSELSIILLILGLRWWAMGVRASHNTSEQNQRLLRVLGLLLAGGLVVGTPVLLIRSVLSLILSSSLVLWFWWRGMQQGIRLDDNQLLISFRVGFVVLLTILIFAVFYLDTSYAPLFAALTQAIPIFFLSGLLGLSFTHIALVQHETARYASDSTAGSTRNWLFVLTLSWLAVVLTVLALEVFSFQVVIIAVSNMLYGIFIVLEWLVTLLAYILTPVLYIFSLLFSPLLRLFHVGRPLLSPLLPPRPANAGGSQQQLSPEALAAGRFVLLLLSLIALYFIVRAILRRLPKARKDDEVEEIREGLSLRSIAQQRRNIYQEHVLQQLPQLETLEPESARAYYRELLQTIASNNPTFARRSDETPTEYQTRLLAFVQHTFSETTQDADMPSEQEILNVLTHTYSVERYAGKHLEQTQKNYLRLWVPRLLTRVVRK